jgi:uncharacterized damage-inducible protein DinB
MDETEDVSTMDRERIVEQIRLAHDGEPWHGSGLQAILTDVTAVQAASRPIPNAHSIWELVLHLTGWTREVTRRLEGTEAGVPPEGDWPPVGVVSPSNWDSAKQALAEAHRELARTVSRAPMERLAARVSGKGDAAETYEEMLHGLTQHDAYHGGQISLLKKAMIISP